MVLIDSHGYSTQAAGITTCRISQCSNLCTTFGWSTPEDASRSISYPMCRACVYWMVGETRTIVILICHSHTKLEIWSKMIELFCFCRPLISSQPAWFMDEHFHAFTFILIKHPISPNTSVYTVSTPISTQIRYYVTKKTIME